MIKVFQATPFHGLIGANTADSIKAAVSKGTEYCHVATVDTNDIEVAWEHTNSIDTAWWLNKGVTTHFKTKGCRSTSVGDIMVTHIAAMFGFRPLGKRDSYLKDAK
jgi:hypothetical protein